MNNYHYYHIEARVKGSSTTVGVWANNAHAALTKARDWMADAVERGDTVVRDGVVTISGPGLFQTIA